jgi:hypothetical protein
MVAFRLKLITAKDIENYAVHYLENNSACTNPYIAELAIGHKNEASDYFEIEHLLFKVIKDLRYSLSEEYLLYEKRKLRYLLLCDLIQTKEHIASIEERIYSVYQAFDYPEDMSEIVECSCCIWYNAEFRERSLLFLAQEKNNLFL